MSKLKPGELRDDATRNPENALEKEVAMLREENERFRAEFKRQARVEWDNGRGLSYEAMKKPFEGEV